MTESTSTSLKLESQKRPIAQKLEIHFLKSDYFRVIHASGVWYGGDAQKNLHLTFFNERNPIPKKIVINLNDQGHVMGEDESQRDTKVGVIREMEVDVILSFQAAVEFHRTLGENLQAIEKATKDKTNEKQQHA